MLGQGVEYHTEYWDKPTQLAFVRALAPVFQQAPFFKPHMPRSNRPWSIVMTNMGSYGWVSDVQGYRYQQHHPETGAPWPALPDILRQAWADFTAYPKSPECCLVNHYQGPKAKMGLHQDRDEEDLSAPVVSFSIGDSAVFRVGGAERRGPTRSIKLHSGDALVLGGAARLNFHGIDRLLVGSSDILTQALPEVFPNGGRLNFTLRRVSA